MEKNRVHIIQEKNKCTTDGRSSLTQPSDLNIQPTLTLQTRLEKAAAASKYLQFATTLEYGKYEKLFRKHP